MFENLSTATKPNPAKSHVSDGEGIGRLKIDPGPGESGTRKKRASKQPAALSPEDQAALDALYSPESWEAVGCLYHDVRAGVTGHEAFVLSDEKRKILGASLAAFMRAMLVIDPKWVAGVVFAVNFAGMVMESEATYALSKRTERKNTPSESKSP